MLKRFLKLELILVAILLLTVIYLRFWQIRDYVVFLGDEGRDMIVMRNMILEMRPVFLGPTASVGGFYLGPIYYWMAAPFLALFAFDPIGPSVMVATIGVTTVFLLFKFLKDAIGFYPAYLVTVLYATAPLIVRYSRSSWNPNPLPFFSLLLIYSLYLAITKKNPIFFLLAGLAFGVAIQLHYLAIMLIPVCALILIFNLNYRKWLIASIFGVLGSLITFSPFLIFEIKHNFPNFITIWEFVTRKSTHGIRDPNIPAVLFNFGNILIEEISFLKGTPITKVFLLVLTISGITALLKNWRNQQKRLLYSIAIIYFIGGLFFLRYYSGQIYDYYYGFMFPAPFLLLAVVYDFAWRRYQTKILCIAFTILSLTWFLTHGFYTKPANMLVNQTEQVSNFVIEKSEEKPFNLALISDHNSDHAYRYFLEIKNKKPEELEKMVTEQLLIVCESQKCEPLGHPIWEIAGFGRAEIKAQWYLEKLGIRIFKLTHWPGEPSPAGKPAVKGI